MESDNRDMRDPEKLGQAMLDMRASRSDCHSLSQAADLIQRIGLPIPNYEGRPVNHALLRHLELKERAINGDRFAAALLNGHSLAEEPVD